MQRNKYNWSFWCINLEMHDTNDVVNWFSYKTCPGFIGASPSDLRPCSFMVPSFLPFRILLSSFTDSFLSLCANFFDRICCKICVKLINHSIIIKFYPCTLFPSLAMDLEPRTWLIGGSSGRTRDPSHTHIHVQRCIHLPTVWTATYRILCRFRLISCWNYNNSKSGNISYAHTHTSTHKHRINYSTLGQHTFLIFFLNAMITSLFFTQTPIKIRHPLLSLAENA